MDTIVRRFSIGPGAIATPSLQREGVALRGIQVREIGSERTDSSLFAMSTAEWLEIQLYVEKGIALPDTAEKLMKKLRLPSSTDLRPYADMFAIYHDINAHVLGWKNNIFPESVNLAKDVHSYSLSVGSLYEPIIHWADILVDNPSDNKAKIQLLHVMTTLSRTVRAYQLRCGRVAGQIQAFANQTLQDRIHLSGSDGRSGLHHIYKNRFNDAASIVDNIKRVLDEDYQLIRKLTKEYNYFTAEAAKTASYVWIWPFGTIAAGIKAGEYGKKASDAWNRIKKKEQEVENFSSDLYQKTQTLSILDALLYETTNITAPLSRGLSIIQSMEGSWKAIADDFDALATIVERNIIEALPCIKELGVENAIKSWEAVGRSADGYRKNAFIQLNPQT